MDERVLIRGEGVPEVDQASSTDAEWWGTGSIEAKKCKWMDF